MLLNYQNFSEGEIYKYIDSLILINEGMSFDIKDRCDKVLSKIKKFPIEKKRKILIYFISSLLTLSSANAVLKAIHSTKDATAISIIENKIRKTSPFKNPLNLHISQKGINLIKTEESLILKAYELGDGKITVGWGHAEDLGKSEIQKGDVISKKQAQIYFDMDLKEAEDGVKRMFNDWIKRGVHRKVTQDQYDALVSMAFNMGVPALRKSDVSTYLESGNYKKAGDIIKKTRISKKFPGLAKRRSRESNMFLSYLFNPSYTNGEI